MKYPKCLKIITLLTVTSLWMGCWSPTSSDEATSSETVQTEEKNDQKKESGLSISIDATWHVDSSAQIYVTNLPEMHYWKIYREDGKILGTQWNHLWRDTTAVTPEMSYRIELFNAKEDKVGQEIITLEKVETSDIGLMYPDKKTRWALGEKQKIIWNPESIPDDSVGIRIYIHGFVRNYQVVNNGVFYLNYTYELFSSKIPIRNFIKKILPT